MLAIHPIFNPPFDVELEFLFPVNELPAPIEFTNPPPTLVLPIALELLYEKLIGLLFAYAYRFNPLIVCGFNSLTSDPCRKRPNSGE